MTSDEMRAKAERFHSAAINAGEKTIQVGDPDIAEPLLVAATLWEVAAEICERLEATAVDYGELSPEEILAEIDGSATTRRRKEALPAFDPKDVERAWKI